MQSGPLQVCSIHSQYLVANQSEPKPVQAADFTWAELQALHGPAGVDIPLVADVVQLLQPSVPNITLDIKLQVVCMTTDHNILLQLPDF